MPEPKLGRPVSTDPNAEAIYTPTPAEIQKFCEDLAHGVRVGEVGNFITWMWETASNDIKQRQVRIVFYSLVFILIF